MERRIIDDSIKKQLDYSGFIIWSDFFLKKSYKSEKKMEHLNDASSKFTQDVYILAEYLLYYCDEDTLEKYIGFAMDYYEYYSTVNELRQQKNFANREIIIRKLVMAIIDLKNNGFIYTDIHSRNILVCESEIKLADMDHVTEVVDSIKDDLIISIWCLIDFIIQVYFYDNLILDFDDHPFGRFMFSSTYQLSGSGMFTEKVDDYLTKVVKGDESILSYDLYEMIELLIKEFSDKERVDEIKKKTHLL